MFLSFCVLDDFFCFSKKNGFWGNLGPPYYRIGATIRIGREMLCLPYAGFLKSFSAPGEIPHMCNICSNNEYIILQLGNSVVPGVSLKNGIFLDLICALHIVTMRIEANY